MQTLCLQFGISVENQYLKDAEADMAARIFNDLCEPLRLSAIHERKVLSRLAKAGLIVRMWRGVSLVPSRLPLGGKWSPDEILALNTLMDNCEGRYPICGPNAFNRYGFDDQIPNRVYAYNNRVSGERTIGAVALTLIKVADERLGDTEKMQTGMAGQPSTDCGYGR